jgi:shikimate kinase
MFRGFLFVRPPHPLPHTYSLFPYLWGMIIFLIGMPASGKSSVGRALARETGYPLIDLDSYIVKKEKLSIPQIFKTKGEEYFRAAESSALREIAENTKDAVVAVGGGTPCYNNNMKLMQNGGKTVYLKAEVNTLASRVENDVTERPLLSKLNGKKLQEKIASMLAHREKFYKQAPLIFETENKTPEGIARELKNFLAQ